MIDRLSFLLLFFYYFIFLFIITFISAYQSFAHPPYVFKSSWNNRHIKISPPEFTRNAVMVLQLHLDHTEYDQYSHFRLDSFLQHLAAAGCLDTSWSLLIKCNHSELANRWYEKSVQGLWLYSTWKWMNTIRITHHILHSTLFRISGREKKKKDNKPTPYTFPISKFY